MSAAPRSGCPKTWADADPTETSSSRPVGEAAGGESGEGMGSREVSSDRASDGSSSCVIGCHLSRRGRSGNTPTAFTFVPNDSPLLPSRIQGFPRRGTTGAIPPIAVPPAHTLPVPESSETAAVHDVEGLGPRQESALTVSSSVSDIVPKDPPSGGCLLTLQTHTWRFATDGPDDVLRCLFDLIAAETRRRCRRGSAASGASSPAPWLFSVSYTETELTEFLGHRQRRRRCDETPADFVNRIAVSARLRMVAPDGPAEVQASQIPGLIALEAFRVATSASASPRQRGGYARCLRAHFKRVKQFADGNCFSHGSEPHARLFYHMIIGSRQQRQSHHSTSPPSSLLPLRFTSAAVAIDRQVRTVINNSVTSTAHHRPPMDVASWVLSVGHVEGRRPPARSSPPTPSSPCVANGASAMFEPTEDPIDLMIDFRDEGVRAIGCGCSVPHCLLRHRRQPPELLRRVARRDTTLLRDADACRQLRDARDNGRASVLQYAACTGDVSWLRTWVFILFADRLTMALNPPPDLHEYLCDHEGRTVLHCAAASGSRNMFEHCVSQWDVFPKTRNRRWDLFAADAHGHTILHYAVMGGNQDMLRLVLYSAPVPKPADVHRLVALAALSPNLKKLHAAIENRVGYLCRLHTAIAPPALRSPAHYAARLGDAEVLKAACKWQGLESYHVPDAHGCTIFHHALRSGSIGCVEAAITLMIQAKSNPRRRCWRLWTDNAGQLPIHFAAWSGSAELVAWLTSKAAAARRKQGYRLLSETPSGATGIHFAARSGNVELFKKLWLENHAAVSGWSRAQWRLLIEFAVEGAAPDMLIAVVDAICAPPTTPRRRGSIRHMRTGGEGADAPRRTLCDVRNLLTTAATRNPGYRNTMCTYIASRSFEVLYRRCEHVWV